MATVREVTFDLLRHLGLTTVFGNPGSTEETFLQDFPDDIRYILGIHEGSVIGAADGYAQATRKPVLVNVHTAAGAANALGATLSTFQNRTPLIITAGQQTREMLLLEPWLSNQDPQAIMAPYVKWAYQPVRPDDVPAAFMRAYAIALQPPAGPVFLSIPMNFMLEETEHTAFKRTRIIEDTVPRGIGEVAGALKATPAGKLAIVAESGSLTYADLDARVLLERILHWDAARLFAHGVEEAEGADDVGVDEVFGTVDGAVDVAFGGEVQHGAGAVLGQQAIDQRAGIGVGERIEQQLRIAGRVVRRQRERAVEELVAEHGAVDRHLVILEEAFDPIHVCDDLRLASATRSKPSLAA